MDPRHPELALPRIKELISQYERIEKDISTSTVSSKLGQFEREGGLVVQEICLVAPRLHEAMMQASRQRRHDLSRGIVFGYIPEEKVGKYTKATIGIEEKPVETPHDGYLSVDEVIEEIPTSPNQDETVVTEPKPRKKKTAKKKAK